MAEMNYIFFLSVGQLQRIFTLGGGEGTLQTNAAITVRVIIKPSFKKSSKLWRLLTVVENNVFFFISNFFSWTIEKQICVKKDLF